MASPPAKRSTPSAAAVAPATTDGNCLPTAGKKQAYENGYNIARSEKTRLTKALDMLRCLLVLKGRVSRDGQTFDEGSHVVGGRRADDRYIPTDTDLEHLRLALNMKLDPTVDINKAEYVKMENKLMRNGGGEGTFEKVMRGMPITDPDPEAAQFRGFIDLKDHRNDLWRGQANEENRMLEVCVLASKFAYENRARAKMLATIKLGGRDSTFFNSRNVLKEARSTQTLAFVRLEDRQDVVYVAFRGSDELADWFSNVDAASIQMGRLGKVHVGFMTALGLLDSDSFARGFPLMLPEKYRNDPPAYYAVRDWVTKKLRELDDRASDSGRVRPLLRVVGHSLGGALAIDFAAVLLYHGWELPIDKVEVVTMGQPRVGDTDFAKNMMMYYTQESRGGYTLNYTRMVYRHDVVTLLPPELDPWRVGYYVPYRHFGFCLYFVGWFKKYELTDDKTMPSENINPFSSDTYKAEKDEDVSQAKAWNWLLMESNEAMERRKSDFAWKYSHFIGEYLNAARHGVTEPQPRQLQKLMQALLHPRCYWTHPKPRHINNYNEGPTLHEFVNREYKHV